MAARLRVRLPLSRSVVRRDSCCRPKLTDIQASLQAAPIGTEFARAQAPIPNIGGIGRVYVVPNISITGELDRLQDSRQASTSDYQAHYFDFDLYGTVNFNDYVGAQIGYPQPGPRLLVEGDHGDFKVKGIYFGGVVRYLNEQRQFYLFRYRATERAASPAACRLPEASRPSCCTRIALSCAQRCDR